MANLILEAVQGGYVDVMKQQYDFITAAIANGLDLDPSRVFDAHRFLDLAPTDDVNTRCTTVLCGNVVAHGIEIGQTIPTADRDVNLLAENFILQPSQALTLLTLPHIEMEDTKWD